MSYFCNRSRRQIKAIRWRESRQLGGDPRRSGTDVPAGTYYVPSAVRANPALANTWSYFSEGDSSYNALQVDVNHRFSSSFALRAVYTWSKTIDDGDSLNATTSGGEPALASNPFNLRADRGLANFDVRNVAAINGIYKLPFGRGQRFLHDSSGFANFVAGGWTANSVVTLQGGFPFTPQLSYNPSNNGDTRNPVRPFANPAFAGPIIIGSQAVPNCATPLSTTCRCLESLPSSKSLDAFPTVFLRAIWLQFAPTSHRR